LMCLLFLVYCYHRNLHSFPTRRSSDLNVKWNIFDRIGITSGSKHGSIQRHVLALSSMLEKHVVGGAAVAIDRGSLLAKNLLDLRDRKSTRLNSSHVKISYAVFCLKKKR